MRTPKGCKDGSQVPVWSAERDTPGSWNPPDCAR